MNETMMREKIHQAVDSHCAHLKEDYWLAQRVIAMAQEPETQPVVRRRKLPVALIVVLVLVLLAATATATTLIWQQYVARVAQLEYQQGDYEKWPAEDRIGLAKDLIQMGYFDEATECARLLSVETPEEERLALADELLSGLLPIQAWRQELATLQQKYQSEYEQYKPMRDDLMKLLRVKNCVDTVLRHQEQTSEKRREVER